MDWRPAAHSIQLPAAGEGDGDGRSVEDRKESPEASSSCNAWSAWADCVRQSDVQCVIIGFAAPPKHPLRTGGDTPRKVVVGVPMVVFCGGGCSRGAEVSGRDL